MTDRARQKRIERNAEQVGKILELWDAWFQRGTAGSSFNLETVKRRGGKSPMSNIGHRVLSDPDNAHAFKHVAPILAELEGTEIGKVAAILRHHPTAIRRWRTEETPNDRYWLERFRVFCRVAAMRLERRYPELSIRVNVRPEEEEADSPLQHRNRENNRKRSRTASDVNRDHGLAILAILEDEEVHGPTAAIGIYKDRIDKARDADPKNVPDVSLRRLWDAYGLVKGEKEREEGGAA
ncbi:MAG: hypothetical protein M3R38_03925 [Actinomycetota bacterium]|nr:hypothetical protein [Actinomycetota bacterium]